MKRTPYVEYYPPWWRAAERKLKFDDQAKRELIGTLMRTRPLTFVLIIFLLAGLIGYGLALAFLGGA